MIKVYSRAVLVTTKYPFLFFGISHKQGLSFELFPKYIFVHAAVTICFVFFAFLDDMRKRCAKNTCSSRTLEKGSLCTPTTNGKSTPTVLDNLAVHVMHSFDCEIVVERIAKSVVGRDWFYVRRWTKPSVGSIFGGKAVATQTSNPSSGSVH